MGSASDPVTLTVFNRGSTHESTDDFSNDIPTTDVFDCRVTANDFFPASCPTARLLEQYATVNRTRPLVGFFFEFPLGMV